MRNKKRLAKSSSKRPEQEKAAKEKEQVEQTKKAEPAQAKNDDAFAIISIVLGASSLTGLGWLASIPGLILGFASLKQSKNRKLSLAAIIINVISSIIYFLAAVAILFVFFMVALAGMFQQTSGQVEIHVANLQKISGQVRIEAKSQRQIEREQKQKEQQQKAEQEKAAKEKEQAEQQKAAEQQAAQDQPATDE